MRRQIPRPRVGRRAAQLGRVDRPDLQPEPKCGLQDTAQVAIAAAAGKTLYIALTGKPDGEDTVLH